MLGHIMQFSLCLFDGPTSRSNARKQLTLTFRDGAESFLSWVLLKSPAAIHSGLRVYMEHVGIVSKGLEVILMLSELDSVNNTFHVFTLYMPH